MFNQFLVEGARSRCCSTPGRGRCSRSCPRRWRRHARRPAALDHVRPCRGRRVRLDERVARGGAGREVAHTAVGCMVSVNDLADRPPRPLEHGEVIDLGGKRVRHLATPHVPHGWDAGLYFEETTGTLLCGDLFTAIGAEPGAHDRRHRRAGDRGRGHVPRDLAHAGDRDRRSARSPTSPRAPSHSCTARRSTATRSAALGALADVYEARHLAAMGAAV